MRPTFICLGRLGWGGVLLDKKQYLSEGGYLSEGEDRYSINYCFRFDKVSTSYRLFVTTFLDVAHDRDQNHLCTLLIFY